MLIQISKKSQDVFDSDIDKINNLFNVYSLHQQKIACFFALSGAMCRLYDNSSMLQGHWYNYEDKNTAHLATISRKTADILYSQIWSNNNETIINEDVNDDDFEEFLEVLNQTNMCSAIRGLLKDIVDIGVGFIYVEEISKEPYVHFKVLNPLNIIKHDGKYFHAWYSNDDDKDFNITVLGNKEEAFYYDKHGTKQRSNMKFSNIISFTKDDSFLSIEGAGVQSIGTAKATSKSEVDMHRNVGLVVNPPVIVNEQMITDDNRIELYEGGITKAAARYDTAAGTPIINALADYRNILPELIQLIQFNSGEIEKAYMLDMLTAPDPELRMSAYQIVRNTMFNSILPKMIKLSIEVFNRKKKVKFKEMKMKFNSLSNSAGEAAAMNNFNQFLNAVGSLEQITQGSGLKLHPSNTVDYLIDVLRLKKDMVFSESELKQMYRQIAAEKQAQQAQQQQAQGQVPQAVQQQQALQQQQQRGQ